MRLLLDTHALVWAVGESPRLSRRAISAINNRRNYLFVSSATAWEVATKFRLGRLPEASLVVRGFESHLHELGAEELPVTVEHALLAGSLEGDHPDPFDRMLAAQAMIEGLQIVTNDPAFDELGAPTIW